jgi:hypothetical protein
MSVPNKPCKVVTLGELLALLNPRTHDGLIANIARPTVHGIVCLENLQLGSPHCGRFFVVDYGPGGFCKTFDEVLRTQFDEVEAQHHVPVAHYVKSPPVFVLRFIKPKAVVRETIVDIIVAPSGPDTLTIQMTGWSTRRKIFLKAVFCAMGAKSEGIEKASGLHRGDDVVLNISHSLFPSVLMGLRNFKKYEGNELADVLELAARTAMKP